MITERPDVLTPFRASELYDPLSDVTRGERKLLLLVSLMSLALTWADLIPTRIESLGIEVSPANRDALIALLGLTLLYFLVAFSVYASADYARWRVARSLAQRQSSSTLSPVMPALRAPIDPADTERLGLLSGVMEDVQLGTVARRRSTRRATFEFAVPLLAGGAGLISMLAELVGLEGPTQMMSMSYSASPAAAISVLVLSGILILLVYNDSRRKRYKASLFSGRLYAHAVTVLARRVPGAPLKRLLALLAVRLFAGRGSGASPRLRRREQTPRR